jgi:hypothetical protein
MQGLWFFLTDPVSMKHQQPKQTRYAGKWRSPIQEPEKRGIDRKNLICSFMQLSTSEGIQEKGLHALPALLTINLFT